jgi:hypothetical protein
MKLTTKAIEKQAQKQYPLGNDMDQKIVAKFFDPYGSWSWYVMNQDPEDTDYLWGIVKGFEVETGSFSLSELTSIKAFGGQRIERDLYFKTRSAKSVWEALNNGIHV